MTSLFTVEQIELIRRLRLSGVTAQQIIEAFQTFDRLDQELPPATHSRMNHNSSAMLPHMLVPPNPFTSTPNSQIFNNCPVSSTNGNHMPKLSAVYPAIFPHQPPAPADIVSMLTPTMITHEDGLPSSVECFPGSTLWSSQEHLHNSSPKMPKTSVGLTNTKQKSSGNSTPVSIEQKTPIRYVSEKLDLNDPELLNNVNEMITHEEATIAEMRDYVTSHQLRQQAIAQMCGISQPYVSKFLNGSYRELSERVRRIIYYWYAKSKRNSPDYMRIVVDSGEPAQLKRERFIFKPVHVRLLEKYFQLDPYPNISKREEMARVLNHAYLAHKGTVCLDEKEVVSEHVVGTWFSNRRKEKKRKDLKVKQMRINQNGGQKSLLNQFLQNLRQSALERNIGPSQAAITVDDSLSNEIGETDDKSREQFPIQKINDTEVSMEHQNGEYGETGLQYQLEAVNNSVYALLNPYSEENENDTVTQNGNHYSNGVNSNEEMAA